MKALLPSIILAGLLASCMNVDSLDSAKPEARLAFRLADSSGALRILASRTCSLKISFRAGTGSAHDTTLAFGSGRWLSPSVSASEDWRIDLIGIDSTGHRIWNGNASGKFQGTSTAATALWTDVPVSAIDSMQVPALSKVSGLVDFPMPLSGSAPAGRAEWSLDSLHWHSFPDTGLILDSAVTLWARTRDTGTLPQPNSRSLRVELGAKQVARPKYSGTTLIGVEYPLILTLDSIPGTNIHWSVDSGRTWSTGVKIPLDRPGVLKAYATRPHQPVSDTLSQYMDGTVIPPTITDFRDGKIYKIVKIGTQVWMAQNLDYVTDSSWAADTSACMPGSPPGCAQSLGRYYTWRAALGLTASEDSGTAKTPIQGICPEDWHLPAPSEWYVLENKTMGIDLNVIWPGNNAPFIGKDTYGFSAYPLSYHTIDGSNGLQNQAWFWSSGLYYETHAIAYGWYTTRYSNGPLDASSFPGDYGMPVRCLKDMP